MCGVGEDADKSAALAAEGMGEMSTTALRGPRDRHLVLPGVA